MPHSFRMAWLQAGGQVQGADDSRQQQGVPCNPAGVASSCCAAAQAELRHRPEPCRPLAG